MTGLDWKALSVRGRAILRTIAVPLAAGYSEREVAKQLAITRPSVLALIDELADELEQLAARSRVLERLDELEHLNS